MLSNILLRLLAAQRILLQHLEDLPERLHALQPRSPLGLLRVQAAQEAERRELLDLRRVKQGPRDAADVAEALPQDAGPLGLPGSMPLLVHPRQQVQLLREARAEEVPEEAHRGKPRPTGGEVQHAASVPFGVCKLFISILCHASSGSNTLAIISNVPIVFLSERSRPTYISVLLVFSRCF